MTLSVRMMALVSFQFGLMILQVMAGRFDDDAFKLGLDLSDDEACAEEVGKRAYKEYKENADEWKVNSKQICAWTDLDTILDFAAGKFLMRSPPSACKSLLAQSNSGMSDELVKRLNVYSQNMHKAFCSAFQPKIEAEQPKIDQRGEDRFQPNIDAELSDDERCAQEASDGAHRDYMQGGWTMSPEQVCKEKETKDFGKTARKFARYPAACKKLFERVQDESDAVKLEVEEAYYKNFWKEFCAAPKSKMCICRWYNGGEATGPCQQVFENDRNFCAQCRHDKIGATCTEV